jgi:hypothetical protein
MAVIRQAFVALGRFLNALNNATAVPEAGADIVCAGNSAR